MTLAGLARKEPTGAGGPDNSETDPYQEWQSQQQIYWDGISDRYDELYSGPWSCRENEWVQAQLSWIKGLKEPTVVDLGCGTGLGLRMIRELNPKAKYIGVDVSPQMAQRVPDTADTTHLVGTMDHLKSIDDESVDVVLALFTTVSYAYRTESVFSEVARILRPGGHAYLSILSSRALSRARTRAHRGSYQTRGDHREGATVPVRTATVAGLHQLSRRLGLKVVRAAGMNALSGLCELPVLWRVGEFVAGRFPDTSHTIELLVEKAGRSSRGASAPTPSPRRAERLHDAVPVFLAQYDDALPDGWVREVAECTVTYAEPRYLNDEGAAPHRQIHLGESTDTAGEVVASKVVMNELPWLRDRYRGDITDLVNGLGLGQFAPLDDDLAVDINAVPAASHACRQVDAHPLTALLFVTDHSTGGGVAFRPDPSVRPNEDWELCVRPRAGDLLIFDAREIAYVIRPVFGPGFSLTVQMRFTTDDSGRQPFSKQGGTSL